MSIDLSTEIGGVKFKNPIMAASGDMVSTVANCTRIISAGVGAIATKTYTSVEYPRSRPRPNIFALQGEGYTQAGAMLGFIGNWPEHIDVVLKRDIPQFKHLCREAGIPLIVSWYGPMDIENGKLGRGVRETWIRMASEVEAAGADLQELNFGCPLVSTTIRDFPSAGIELIDAVCGAGFPAGIKINPTWEPLEDLVKGWLEAGVKFITAHNLDIMGLVIDVEEEVPKYAPAIGGYSPGRLFLPWSLSRIARIRKSCDVPVFAVGGVHTAEDALQYLLCGASIVQVHGLVYFNPPGIVSELIRGIESWRERKGYHSINEFRGKVLPMVLSWQMVKTHGKNLYVVPPECPYITVVDENKCDLCGKCEVCINGVYKIEDNKLLIQSERCDNCGFCLTICPQQAIVMVDKNDRSKIVWNIQNAMAKPYRELLKELTKIRNDPIYQWKLSFL